MHASQKRKLINSFPSPRDHGERVAGFSPPGEGRVWAWKKRIFALKGQILCLCHADEDKMCSIDFKHSIPSEYVMF